MSQGEFGYGSTARGYRGSPEQNQRDDPGGFNRGYQRPRGASFSELVDQISSNIFMINSNATTLERSMKQIGTSTDSVRLRDRIHTAEQSTNDIIATTVRALKQLASQCHLEGNRQQKLQNERLTGEFKDVVKAYNTLQKKVAAKVKSSVSLGSPQPAAKPADLITWGETVDDEAALVEQEQRRQQLQAQAEEVEADVAILQEREDRIRQLESDILDINEIFRDLGTMVHEQGEIIDTIEANVEDAANYVESGGQELVKAARYQRKARKKMCCLIIILLVVVTIIALIIYFSLKK